MCASVPQRFYHGQRNIATAVGCLLEKVPHTLTREESHFDPFFAGKCVV
jgi:hypothetical protein